MNWDAIGAAGEIAGAVAVVLSLLYLSGQIRASKDAMAEAAIQNILDLTSNWLGRIAGDTEVAAVFVKGMGLTEEMTEAERMQFSAMLLELTLNWERHYYLSKKSDLYNPFTEGNLRARKLLMGAPGFKSWFNERSLYLSNEFAQVLKSQMEQSGEYSVVEMRKMVTDGGSE